MREPLTLMVAVVPANAGTHTPRLSDRNAIITHPDNARCLWVPAFAGTTFLKT